LYDAIVDAGRSHDMVEFGTYAMGVMRLEKGYKAWGSELTTEITPVEADIMRFVDLSKEFKGKAATVAREGEDLAMVCVYAELDAADADCRGNEPTLDAGRVMGITTAGTWAHSVGKGVFFAYVEPKFAAPGSSFEVRVMNDIRQATVLADPVWDPKNERIRA
ncbi:MAG: aminomethyl transferase family protein, partial [Acidimicrobiia bacterium]|nr:aminomethyl transferase family protein [Acidimicrobiia bacterium]